jgi:hypothetical protein
MIRTTVTRSILLPLTLFFATVAFPQKVEREGKAWLAEQTAPAEVNVNGSWHDKSWGQLVLSQREGSRDFTGTGAGYDLLGVVSGKQVFLLFCSRKRVEYSAQLTWDGQNSLNGQYTAGMMGARHIGPRGRLRDIHLMKAN